MEAEDPAKKGVCSNYLCDAEPGDDLKVTGPTGKVMLIPEKENFDADLIMVATGTGIAPYRSFIRRLFVEQTHQKGGKMYIQDKMEEYADEVFSKLDNGAHIYFCGLKGMMPGIQEMLQRVAGEKGMVWEDTLKKWKKGGQWHVEVY